MKDAENFCYAKEIKLASEEGRLAEDIKKEQEKLKEADLVIFQVVSDWECLCGQLTGVDIKMTIKPVFPVPHVLVICSCNHEGVDGSCVGLCLRTGEAVQ